MLTKFLLVFVAVLVGVVCARDVPGEILKNPSFDEEDANTGLPAHWNTSHERILWREKTFMGGDYEIVSKPPAYVLATQPIALEPGKEYTLTVTCKGQDGAIMGALIVHGKATPVREMPLLWNVEPTSRYEQYVRTFVAPNPIATLFIYNIGKSKGTISYDHVSLREGRPDHAVISQLTFKPIDRPLEDMVETPHIPWARPLPEGPVRSFVTIRAFRCIRQVYELAQRFEMDYDVVDTGYEGNLCVSDTGRRAMQRLKDNDYEVYVVTSRISDVLAETIRERVEAGAGLFVIQGFGRVQRFMKPAELQPVDDNHFLLAGIPWDAMPEKLLESVDIGHLGKGRVVRMLFPSDRARVWGLIPTENSRERWQRRQFEFWEWWESLFAKGFLWAARREGPTTIRCTNATPQALTVKVDGAPAGSKARVLVRSAREIRFDGPLLREPLREIPLDADHTLTIAVPDTLPAGLVIADVMVLDAGGNVLTWGSFTTATPQAVRIAECATDRAAYAATDTVSVNLKLATVLESQTTIEAKLIDAYGRVSALNERSVALAVGEHELNLDLPLRSPLCVHHKAFVRVLVDGHEQDSDWLTVLVPEVGPRLAAQDFVAMPWGPGMTHPIIENYYAEKVREIGMNGDFGRPPYLVGERGMLSAGYAGAGGYYRETKHLPDGVRRQCLSDPANIEDIRRRVRESAEKQKEHGVFAVGITDEAFLSSRHERTELCFSPHCTARYRQWLKARYETLDALNAQWDTSFGAWEDIRGARTEEVRGTANYGPFVDFRTFMTDVWVDACRVATEAYQEVAPHVPMGHTNTFGAGPFNGNDYWKLSTRTGFGWGQEYSEAIKSTGHKAVFDLWRSFVETPEARSSRTAPGATPAPFFNYGWIGYDHVPAAAHYEPWWLALHGARGVSYYATNSIAAERGACWSLVFPTLSLTAYSMAVKEALTDLRAGCGKLFLEYEREEPGIALLWSHPSMLVAWCESSATQPVPDERDGTDSYGAYFRSALHIRQHLNELQHDYTYISPEQILTSDLLSRYPVLFLPFTVAIGEELIDKLATYVQNGGTLIGDLRCLRTDEHGKPFADSAHLKRLFGIERTTDAPPVYEAGTAEIVSTAEDLGLVGRELDVYGRESIAAAGATPIARHASGEPAVLVHALDKGRAVYLNFSLPKYDVAVRELIEQVLRRAGLERTVVVENPATNAPPPRCYERNSFHRGPIAVHGFIRDHRRCDDHDPVRFRLGNAAHVYDVRARQYLGRTDTVLTTVTPGHTVLYACLPYRAGNLSVVVPDSVSAGATLAVQAVLAAQGGSPGDHIFHVELRSPQGLCPTHYTRNELAPTGRLSMAVPMAINEARGQWRIEVRDVLTGITGSANFTVTAP